MSKFNQKSRTVPNMVNLAGGAAFDLSTKTKIATFIFTCYMQAQFYRKESDSVSEMESLFIQAPTFSAKALIYARNVLGVRSVTHLGASILAPYLKGLQGERFFYDVVRRVDDITEILSVHLDVRGQKLSSSMKRGLAKAFEKFDAYQLAKYRSEGNKMTLRRAMQLLHPKPTEMNARALAGLKEGTLKQGSSTWESALSAAGSDMYAKRKVWSDLLSANKLGYFALIRNLKNIIETSDSEIISMASNQVADNVSKKQLMTPFDLYKSYEIVEGLDFTGKTAMIRSLNTSIDFSLANVPNLGKSIAVILDVSGSMTWKGSGPRGRGTSAKNGSLFASAIMKAHDNVVAVEFDGRARTVYFNPSDSMVSISRSFSFNGGGTNFESFWPLLNQKFDAIVVLSDMQAWIKPEYGDIQKCLNRYKSTYNPNVDFYSFDLSGYGTLQVPESKTYTIAGFGANIFETLAKVREFGSLTNVIDAIEL